MNNIMIIIWHNLKPSEWGKGTPLPYGHHHKISMRGDICMLQQICGMYCQNSTGSSSS